ncbi:MAG: phosphate signaling complex protein PhoU [Synergistaceae bacterium]|nr:phosphate signaling complex protein PhoU [Synergistaceae bacterium]
MNRYKDQEIESLFGKVFQLGAMAERAMRDAIWALSNQDRDIARKLMDGDDAVDALALEINTVSFQLIARYQPVAFDLRALEACIRMALDLERIADLAASVARVTLDLDPRVIPFKNVQPMGERVIDMLNTAMTSLTKRDISLAETIFVMDDAVDDLEDIAFIEMMETIIQNPSLAGGGKLITVPRLLERAGDHVTNIAEQICYMLVGRRVKSTEYRRPKPEPGVR